MSDNEVDTTTRRRFLQQSGLIVAAGTLTPQILNAAPAYITPESARPQLLQGLQIGDVQCDRAMIWSRSDRPARMLVEYDIRPDFKHPIKLRGPYALETTDFTARLDLRKLPNDQELFVRVMFQDLSNDRILSEPITGRFLTASRFQRDIRFLWSGDTAGQGWGINPDVGGMRIYETMRQQRPDFFIHCGDTIYADGPITETQEAENGQIWRNIVTEEVSKVAETLDEFRGRYKYNMLDDNVRRFNAEVPQIWQWDDHEVTNNWSDSKDLSGDPRYMETNIPTLVANGTKAFLEYAPLRYFNGSESERVYRKLSYGNLLDVFVIDMRSYRGPNSSNDQLEKSDETALLGEEQLRWLKHQLTTSRAVWKVIASDMPIGLVVRDGADKFENMANGDGPAMGRELEMKELLRYIKRKHVDNVVWFTADVHYTAAHYYDPNQAQFQDFEPFWEFVSGPLNAGTFGPGDLDNTFGPQVKYHKVPEQPNLSPLAGLQFFGQVDIDARSANMSVTLKDSDGNALYRKTLEPERRHRRRWS